MNDSAEIIDIEGDEKKPAEKKVKVAAASFQKKKPAEKLPVERPDVTMAFLQEDAFSSDMMLNEEEELLRDHALMKDLQFDLEEEDASTKNTEGFSIKEKIQPISQKFPAVTSQVDLLSMPMSHSAATLLGEKRHKKKWVKVQKQSFKNGYLGKRKFMSYYLIYILSISD